MGNTVALSQEKPLSFSDQLKEALTQNQAALPPGFNTQRFIVNALELLNNDEKLRNYPAPILKQALLKTAYLDVDASQGDVFLVGYGKTIDVQISYTGMERLARKYSLRPIKDVGAELVRDGDEFEMTVDGEDTVFTFKPKPFSDAPVIGGFGYIRYEDGGTTVERMTIREIENVHKQSKMPNSPAWKNFSEQMMKKVLLRRTLRRVRLDMTAYQMKLWNEDNAIKTTPEPVKVDNPFTDADVVDGEAMEVSNSGENN